MNAMRAKTRIWWRFEARTSPSGAVRPGSEAARRPLDALQRAGGASVHMLAPRGRVAERDGFATADGWTVVASADATRLLHDFACWCAERVLGLCEAGVEAAEAAIDAKRRWLDGGATDAELKSAREAARRIGGEDAAADAAARACGRDAARSASETSAWSAYLTATCPADWASGWAEINTELDRRLTLLFSRIREEAA